MRRLPVLFWLVMALSLSLLMTGIVNTMLMLDAKDLRVRVEALERAK